MASTRCSRKPWPAPHPRSSRQLPRPILKSSYALLYLSYRSVLVGAGLGLAWKWLAWKFLEFAGAEIMRRAVEILRRGVEILRQAAALRRVDHGWRIQRDVALRRKWSRLRGPGLIIALRRLRQPAVWR